MSDSGLLEQAVEMLRDHELPPTPNNYAVAYGYFAGGNDGLVSAMDRLFASRPDARLTQEDCDEIYECFLSPSRDDRYDELIKLIGHSSEGLLEGIRHTGDYQQALEEGVSSLSSDLSQAQARKVVGLLLEQTLAMQDSANQLKARLEDVETEVESLRQEIQQVSAEAELDPLTGLANRRTFSRRIESACRKATARDEPLCLIMADIDFFKRFNDTYGHAIGDNVLCHVAARLEKLARKDDLVARYGGEEFIVLLPETRIDQAIVVAERFRQAVAATVLRQSGSQKVLGRINLSLGVATYRPGESSFELIARADAALYVAKNDGRNCVRVEQALADTQQEQGERKPPPPEILIDAG